MPPEPKANAKGQTPRGWALLDGAELPVRLRLPFASEWRRRETKTSLRLEHSATQTQMVVRLWPASRLVTTEQCQSELALLEPDPALAQQISLHTAATQHGLPGVDMNVEGGDVVIEKPFEPGADFHGVVRAAVHPASSETAMTGIVFAAAAGIGRCVALVATTIVTGAGAELELADRLTWIVEGSTSSLRVRTVEARVKVGP